MLGGERILCREGPRLAITRKGILSVFRFYSDGFGSQPHSLLEAGAEKFMFILHAVGELLVRYGGESV